MIVLSVLGSSSTYHSVWLRKMRRRSSPEYRLASYQLEVQLRRRCDLIAELIQSVRGSAKGHRHELQRLVNVRNQALSAKEIHEQIHADESVCEALDEVISVIGDRDKNCIQELSNVSVKVQLAKNMFLHATTVSLKH